MVVGATHGPLPFVVKIESGRMIAEVARPYHQVSRLEQQFSRLCQRLSRPHHRYSQLNGRVFRMMRAINVSQAEAKHRLLYVGKNPGLLGVVRAELKDEGWFVVRCPGLSGACVLLESGIPYDLLMFDEGLADAGGRGMVRLVRSLEHRKLTPIIILSQGECRAETWQAEGGVFIRKPEPFYALAEGIRRLPVPEGAKRGRLLHRSLVFKVSCR